MRCERKSVRFRIIRVLASNMQIYEENYFVCRLKIRKEFSEVLFSNRLIYFISVGVIFSLTILRYELRNFEIPIPFNFCAPFYFCALRTSRVCEKSLEKSLNPIFKKQKEKIPPENWEQKIFKTSCPPSNSWYMFR